MSLAKYQTREITVKGGKSFEILLSSIEPELFDRISEIYNFTDFEYADIKQIVEELSEVEITKEAVKLIQNKATSFRQIVQMIDNFEKVAQANSLNIIDENIAGDILNG